MAPLGQTGSVEVKQDAGDVEETKVGSVLPAPVIHRRRAAGSTSQPARLILTALTCLTLSIVVIGENKSKLYPFPLTICTENSQIQTPPPHLAHFAFGALLFMNFLLRPLK